MVGKAVQKLTVQDKLGIVIVTNTFCDQTDDGKVCLYVSN